MTEAQSYGAASMVAPLHRVIMRRPGPELFGADPTTWHYAAPLDAERVRRQHAQLADLVTEAGAEIVWMEDCWDGQTPLADAIFTFDASLVTARGAILLNPGKTLRASEAQLHRAVYERAGVPVVGEITSPGTVEGGDCLWLDETTLCVGVGFRTNTLGVDQLRAILAPTGVTVEAFDLPTWSGSSACLHLLSLISPLDHDLALVWEELLPVRLFQLLQQRGIDLISPPLGEIQASRGLVLNVLATAPRKVIAIDGFTQTRTRLETAGCEVSLFEADALCLPCEGGPTCLTRPLLRA